jgi:mRNA interferase MazF
VTQRGNVCWADLGEPRGSKPAKRRPVLVIQADPYNTSRLNTTLVIVITSNTGLAAMPGNVFVPAIASGLARDSVVNVTALVTLDKTDLDPAVGQLPSSLMHEVDRGLRRVLGLLSDSSVQIMQFWRQARHCWNQPAGAERRYLRAALALRASAAGLTLSPYVAHAAGLSRLAAPPAR